MVSNDHSNDAAEGDIIPRPSLSSDPMLTADGICGMDEDYRPVQPKASTITHEEVHDRIHDFDDAGGVPSIRHK